MENKGNKISKKENNDDDLKSVYKICKAIVLNDYFLSGNWRRFKLNGWPGIMIGSWVDSRKEEYNLVLMPVKKECAIHIEFFYKQRKYYHLLDFGGYNQLIANFMQLIKHKIRAHSITIITKIELDVGWILKPFCLMDTFAREIRIVLTFISNNFENDLRFFMIGKLVEKQFCNKTKVFLVVL